MSNDHPQVASRAASEPELNRYHELLDREILPCLERPGRYIGPFEVRGFAPEGASAKRLALLWPSVPESHRLPRGLAPFRQALENQLRTPLDFACAPAPECAAQLDKNRLPYFTRPGWLPLSTVSALAIWFEDPAQVFGFLSILEASGLPLRAKDRSNGPRVWAAGPATRSLAALLPAWADEVLAISDPTRFAEALAEALLASSPKRGQDASSPAISAPRSSNPARLACPDVGVGQVQARLILPEHLRCPLAEVRHGFAGARVTRLHVLAASSRLRASLGLSCDEELQAAVREALAHESRQLELQLAVGLPGEQDEDRTAIGAFLEQLVRIAPRGARQIQLVLSPYLAASAEDATPAQLARWVGAIESRARSLRLKSTFPSLAGLSLLSWILRQEAQGAEAIEALHAAGVRHGDADLVFELAMRAPGFESVFAPELSDDPSAAEALPQTEASGNTVPTGLERVLPIPASLDEDGHPLLADELGKSGRKDDRWRRWSALVPHEHQLRLIFEKRDQARHLSHREMSDLLVEACRRGGVPLAIAGVVSPRPKLSFGPSLPVGVAGLHEFVDLSLTRKPSGILSAINEHLPEGLLARAARYLPPGARRNFLPVERARYRVTVPSERVDDLHKGLDRFRSETSWEIERVKGERITRLDLKAQVTNIVLHVDDAGSADLRFDLALDTDGARPRPREFVASLLGVDRDDVRTLPLTRECLLSRGGDLMGSWKTPLELVDVAMRRSRQAIKRNT